MAKRSEVGALVAQLRSDLLMPEDGSLSEWRALLRAAQRMRRYSQVCNRKVCLRQDACNAARAYDRAKKRILDAK